MNTRLFSGLVAMAAASIVGGSLPASHLTIVGTADDTPGVYLFPAGGSSGTPVAPTGAPGAQPTDDVIATALGFGVFTLLGDEPAEQLAATSGAGAEDFFAGVPDAEITQGLTTVDDFGFLEDANDDAANVDLGSAGFVKLGFDPTGDDDPNTPPNPNPLVIAPDGVTTTGVIGTTDEVVDAAGALAALDGFEIFILEDAELSGMVIRLEGDGALLDITIRDRQVDPLTELGADDVTVAIDLDSLMANGQEKPLFPGRYVSMITIFDDGIPMSTATGAGGPLFFDGNIVDTTAEIDAVLVLGGINEDVIPEPGLVISIGFAGLAFVYGMNRRRKGGMQ
jgi:hypothetical protein